MNALDGIIYALFTVVSAIVFGVGTILMFRDAFGVGLICWVVAYVIYSVWPIHKAR